jgi:hypothetical protein
MVFNFQPVAVPSRVIRLGCKDAEQIADSGLENDGFIRSRYGNQRRVVVGAGMRQGGPRSGSRLLHRHCRLRVGRLRPVPRSRRGVVGCRSVLHETPRGYQMRRREFISHRRGLTALALAADRGTSILRMNELDDRNRAIRGSC